MTATASDTDQLLALIHEAGYWRVLIHPTTFEPQRIPELADCWRIVEKSRVSQRGWDYPYVDRADQAFGNDWVQCGVAFANFIEVWRFYQSAQFVHHFAVTEDREDSSSLNGVRGPSRIIQTARTLSFVNVVYTMTEILEFARRLAHHNNLLAPAASIQVELHGMSGRVLTAPYYRHLSSRYASDANTICWQQSVPVAELIATAPVLAVDASVHVLERFNWIDPPRRALQEEQQRFYQKRWR
jgi:hypothetical protein